MKTLDDLFNEEEVAAKAAARAPTEAERARHAAKAAAELERGIRLGWLNADGSPVETADDDTDAEDDDDEAEAE